MEIFRTNDIRQRQDLNSAPTPMRFSQKKSRAEFVWAGLKNNISIQPIRYTIQVVALLAFLAFGIFGSFWKPLIIFVVLSIIGRGTLALFYLRIYNVRRRGHVKFRIDKYGISTLIDNSPQVRLFTDSWLSVKKIVAHKDYLVIDMASSANCSEYLLFADNTGIALDNILAFWHMSLAGIDPEEEPSLYTSQEIEVLQDFISEHFGEIETIGHESKGDKLHIDLAYVVPTDNQPYYTICTIGAGAKRLKLPDEDRIEKQVPEYVEYVIHLPPSWNCLEEGFDKEENWWPIRMLKEIARMSLDFKDFYPWVNVVVGWNTELPEVNVRGALFDWPLPDMENMTLCNLPTGASVAFIQIIPITKEEYNSCGEEDDDDRYERLIGATLDNKTLISHFNKLIHPVG